MKKRMFDRELYVEGLRQLRMCGLILTLVSSVFILYKSVNMLICLSHAPDSLSEISNVLAMYTRNLSVFTTIAMAFLAPLILFRFLNRRHDSDFYHALAPTRRTLYTSFAAAVLTWMLIVLLIPFVLMLGLTLVTGMDILPKIPELLFQLGGTAAAAVLIIAATLLSMSITGTVFANIVATLLILFLPRLVLSVFVGNLNSSLPMINGCGVFGLLEANYNLVSSGILDLLSFLYSDNISFVTWSNLLYTLILGLVYLALAGVMFCRRKSEAAGHTAGNRPLQIALRLGIPMAISLLGCRSILNSWINGIQSSVSGTVLIYLVALIAFFVYELLTTRKWSSLLKAIPSLGILVVFNLLFIFGFLGCRNAVLSYAPKADEIESVSIVPCGQSSFMSNRLSVDQWNDSHYFNLKLKDVHLTDETVRTFVSDRLALEIRRNEYRTVSDSDSSYTVFVTIRSHGTEHRRLLYLSYIDYEDVLKQMAADEAVYDAITTLPTPKHRGDVTITVNQGGDMQERFTETPLADEVDLYAALRADLARADTFDWLWVLAGTKSDSYYKDYSKNVFLNLEIHNGGRTLTQAFNLPKFFTKTAIYCADKTGQKRSQESTLKILRNLTIASKASVYKSWMELTFANMSDQELQNGRLVMSHKGAVEAAKELVNWLIVDDGQQVDHTKPIVCLQIGMGAFNASYNPYYTVVLNTRSADIPPLLRDLIVPDTDDSESDVYSNNAISYAVAE